MQQLLIPGTWASSTVQKILLTDRLGSERQPQSPRAYTIRDTISTMLSVADKVLALKFNLVVCEVLG